VDVASGAAAVSAIDGGPQATGLPASRSLFYRSDDVRECRDGTARSECRRMTDSNGDPRRAETTDHPGVQLRESRRSLDRSFEQLQDIDDKAMRTTRVALVVIGLLVTGAGVATGRNSPSIGLVTGAYTGLGAIFLASAVVAGIGTYSATEYKRELSDHERAFVERAERNGGSPALTLSHFNYDWIDTLEEEIENNLIFLDVTMTMLYLGALSLLAAGAVIAVSTAFTCWPAWCNAFVRRLSKALAGQVPVALVSGSTKLLVRVDKGGVG
jgi:predicted O-methyltransferase YrrM